MGALGRSPQRAICVKTSPVLGLGGDVAGTVESNRMTTGLALGAGIFIAAAILGERHALYIPAVVLLVAACVEAVAGPLW